MRKVEVREQFTKFFLALAAKAKLLEFEPIKDSQFEVRIRFAKIHSKGTIEEGKIIKIEPYDDAKHAYDKIQAACGLS